VGAAGLCAALAACGTTAGTAGRSPDPAPITPGATAGVPRTPAEQARLDGGRPPYTAADVRFMQGMIAHHAQALVMARWAPTHGAAGDIRTLAGRIEVSQQDEIDFMQRWLRERGEAVPEPGAHAHAGGHAAHHGSMPGMLTPEQLAQLDAARGAEFDRLFLTFMMQHHEGAVRMVRELFATRGAGQDVNVFRFASDVEADQTTEIDRMRTMLAARK
jgi:uncharacterized protein (DUF305 family)